MKGKFYSTLALSLFLAAAASVSFAQGTGIKSTNQQFDRLLTKIETKIDILKDETGRINDRGSNGQMRTDDLSGSVASVQESVTKLHETFDARQPVRDDLNEVLRNATQIDQYLLRNRVSPSAQSQWKSLKLDLTTLAGYGRVNWNWNAAVTPVYPSPTPTTIQAYTATDTQMRTLLSRIDLKTGIYKSQMDTALRADSSADVSDRTVTDYVSRFETSVDRLRERFDSRQTTTADATEVLTSATYLDQFMTRNRLTSQVQAQWRNLKGDLNILATYYRQSWNWNQTFPTENTGNTGNTGPRGQGNFDRRITGTYRLNTSLSEDPAAVLDRALGSNNQSRDNSRAGAERRLRSPEMIAIEMNDQTVNMASSILPKVAFQADGVAQTETNARGRTITTTATVDADGLIINYQGERANDFYVTFLPTNDRKLKVTRRIYIDNNSEGVTVTSVYDKIDNVARWASITTNNNGVQQGGVTGDVQDSYVVAAGTRLTAELRSRVTSSPLTDRFTMEVTSPGQYRRAVISGRVIGEDANSRSSGRTRLLIAFDTIRLNDGRTYRFAGNVDAVTSPNGESMQVSNQTPVVRTQQQQNAGVGSILGALLGAISGAPADQGGSSATTQGAVIVQQGDYLTLDIGSQFMITATNLR